MAPPENDPVGAPPEPKDGGRRVSMLYRVESDSIKDVYKDAKDGDLDEVEEAVEDALGELRDKDDPGSFLNGQPTFEASLHLAAAVGLWRLYDVDASAEHLRRVHAIASSNTNPRHRKRFEETMRVARNLSCYLDYPALEEFPKDANSPQYGPPPEMIVDDFGEIQWVLPEGVRGPAVGTSQATRGLASDSQQIPSSPATTAVSQSGTHEATLASSFPSPAAPDVSGP